jgi:hypothetical protein
MPAPTDGPHPADPDGISDAVDELERRVVGRQVDPPRSDDLTGEQDAGEAPDGSGRGASEEPS